MLSSICSALIDVLKFAYYNIHMDENIIVNLLAMETDAPKRRITRSVGAIYVALIALMIGCISIGNLLYERWQIPRYLTQPILYILIALCGYYLYRRHYIRYRYTLTNEMLAIEQIGGSQERTIAAIMLGDIRTIGVGNAPHIARGKIIHASLPPHGNATRITVKTEVSETTYIIRVSEVFVQALQAAKDGVLQTPKAENDEALADRDAQKDR